MKVKMSKVKRIIQQGRRGETRHPKCEVVMHKLAKDVIKPGTRAEAWGGRETQTQEAPPRYPSSAVASV